jgi:thiamine biosynthesis lipoprotein
MKQTKILMGMPITVEITDSLARQKDIEDVFNYFQYIDATFSTYKKDSEISKINRKEITEKNYSKDMQLIFQLAEKTKQQTQGYFDIVQQNGLLDPSGVVKGWAILQASHILERKGCKNFYVDAGGDVQVFGSNEKGNPWTIGIRNPFNHEEIIKVVQLFNQGIATSGTYIRGQHIYDPFKKTKKLTEIVSITIIGPDVLEADRFATAAFAMQRDGITFIEKQKNLEGYMIDKEGLATYTNGFEKYVI